MSVKLIRPELQQITPYSVKRSLTGIRLNANEAPWDDGLNRYPDPIGETLLTELAAIYQVPSSQLMLTRGSDEGIDIIIRLFCRPYLDEVIICPPTFSMYAQSAMIQGAKIVEVPLQERLNFAPDFQQIIAKLTHNTKLIFICSPNNPTGNLVSATEILKLVAAVKDKAIVVVDEAYIEFTEADSLAKDLSHFDNLIVLRTLSKAYGLAGLRCGILLAPEPLIPKLQAVMPPYPFSVLTLKTLLTIAKKKIGLREKITYIKAHKERMQENLSTLKGVKKIWRSDANFVLVKFNDATALINHCEKNGIYLRNLSKEYMLEDCVRITIGLADENQQLFKVLSEYYAK
ncbi:MAG: histidinol-phosphate transaminase [Candidatus Berkiellales bacterium]